MDADEERARWVFLKAVAALKPEDQAAIVDRECAGDLNLRKRVEELLAACQDANTVLDERTIRTHIAAPQSSDGTVAIDSSTGSPRSGAAGSEELPVTERDPAYQDREPVALTFLQPSSRPGSLGRLNQHEVLEVLGKGGFGIVVRAFDETLQRVVAIKVLSPELAATSPARKRFLREARASARVRHENVVQIHTVEESPIPYLVMEYIPGQTLQQRLEENGPLEVTDVLRIGGQIARGLAAAHQQGLIHRDIKPGNILLESGVDQKVKITDFGLARAADDASLSQSGVIAGTPLYMAPEQASGGPPDPRADLFSLGSVLYTMVSGRPPFRAANTVAVLKRVAEDTPRPIREIIPESPQWLSHIISKLHAKDPGQRFQSASEVASLLEQHLAHLQHPSLVARPDSVRVPGRRGPRRAAFFGGATAVVLGSVAAFSYPLWRPARPSSNPPAPNGPVNVPPQPPTPAAATAKAAPVEPPQTYVLQGRSAVRDALIDFSDPDRGFGASARDNALRLADRCNAFLVRFDLDKLGVPPNARVAKATASFFVWDPSSVGKTKICAFPLKTEWDEVSATWREPAVNKSWKGGSGFAFGADTGDAGSSVVVEPEQQGRDTENPPIEYQLDVTDLVRSWLSGKSPNLGLAIAPAFDRNVDGGTQSRFQIFGSESNQEQYTPKLTLQVQP